MLIAIINNKGGVGKTATAVNLGHALALLGKKVLVIDMDSQCNATEILFQNLPSYQPSLYDIFASENSDITNCIVSTEHENLFLLPNIPETAGLEPELIAGAPDSFFRLRKAIRDYALKHFDFTLLDNPPNMGTFVISSLLASDFVIVPTEAGSKYSADGLVKAVKLIEETRQKLNPDLRFLKLLVTKVDRRTSIANLVLDQIRSIFPKEKVFDTYVPVNTDLQKAEFQGKTIFSYRSSAPAAHAYRKLAEELIQTIGG